MKKKEIEEIIKDVLRTITFRNFFLYITAIGENDKITRSFEIVNFHNPEFTDEITQKAKQIADTICNFEEEVENIVVFYEDIVSGRYDIVYPQDANLTETDIEEEIMLFRKRVFKMEKINHTVLDGVFLGFVDCCIEKAFKKAKSYKYDKNAFVVFNITDDGKKIAPAIVISDKLIFPGDVLEEFNAIVKNHIRNGGGKDFIYPIVFVSLFINESKREITGEVLKLNNEKVSSENFKQYIFSALKLVKAKEKLQKMAG